MTGFSHFDASGHAVMVDVGSKPETERAATARARVAMQPATLRMIIEGAAKKGDVLGVARLAGIMGAKRTPDLIPLCQARGTSLVIGGPLNSGILAGRDTWNYDTAPPEIVERVKMIAAVCKAHNVPLAAAALQFPLAHPVVAAVIPGPRSAAELNENLPLLTMKIPPGLWSDLRNEKLLHPNAPVPA